MDKIYSRHKVRIPKLKIFYSDNKKSKRILILLVILIIAAITFYGVLKSITPIFQGLCIEKVMNIATEIINKETSNVLDNIDYGDIVTIIKDADNTNILKTDVVKINKIASDIALQTEINFKDLENETIKIPIGALTGNKYLAGTGPGINIKVIPTGNVLTELKTEFETKGINQTIYRIYMEINCSVSILTPYNTINKEVINQVLLVETLIVGEVPQTYYNLKGMTNDDLLNMVD